MSSLGISPERFMEGDRVVIRLVGELDISGAEPLQRTLIELDRDPPALVVLDLQDLRFIDSSGLRIILAADDAARHGGRRVALIPGPKEVQDVFRTTRLEERLNFVERPEDLPRGAPCPPSPNSAEEKRQSS